MTDSRILEILRILKKEDDFVTAEELAVKVGVRPRTLRELMRQCREEAEDHGGASLIYKYNYGYRLMIPDPARFDRYLKEQKKLAEENQYIMPVTPEERRDYIIRQLLMKRTPTKSEDIIEQMYISRSTLAGDLKLVRTKLQEYGLNLDSRSGGLLITGDEHQIRACISDFFFYTDFAQSETFREQPIGIFGMYHEQDVTDAVAEVLQEHAYRMTDVGINNLKVHILIALYRIRNQENIPQKKPTIDEEHFALEFAMAAQIRDRILKKTGIRISDDELGYMVVHMVGTRMFSEDDANMISPETINVVRVILTEILNRTGIDFFRDIELFTMLCTHMEPMLSRIRNHVKMRNPLLERIKEENHSGFDLALMAGEIITRIYHCEVDENESGYLALHFELALRRRNEKNKKRILTVCASGAGTSRLLRYNLEQHFAGSIEKIRSAGLNEVMNMDLSDYDLIISTVPIARTMSVPVLVVQYYLSSADMDEIRRNLEFDGQAAEDVLKAFPETLYFDHFEAEGKNELIHFLCTKMAAETKVPSNFEVQILQRESLASTEMGNGIAVPHPSVVLLEENKIAVCHLKNPVLWKKNKVNWVFLMGMKKENDEASELLSRTLFQMINDKELMADLSEHPQYTCFIEKMKGLLAVKEKEKPESIFQ